MSRYSLCFAWAVLFTACPRADADPDAFSRQVEIRRDSFGVPHILAETEEAAAFGYGYAAAEDHAEDIARLYLKARSREARYFGPAFEKADVRNRLFRVHEAAEAGFAASPEWMQRILDAYAAGFNRYVEKNRAKLAEWVEPITGIDVLAHARRVVNIEFALDDSAIDLIPGEEESGGPQPGSNMFAIGKERSASGHALLVGNPHLAWSGSQVWHEWHVTVPGELNMHGASLIGFPGINLGFNDRLGWSHTVNPHDASDLYELTLVPGDPESYLYDGQPRKLTQRDVTIEVLEDGNVTKKTHTLRYAHLGPIVAEREGKVYALRTPNWDEYRMLEQWHRMTKARTLDEFRATLDLQGIPMFNIAYADVEGNCFYICNGRFPERPAGPDWAGIVRGDTSATAWKGVYPPSRLPQLLNPAGGYVHNSNNAPWYTNLGALIDKSTLPADVIPDDNDLRSQLGLSQIDGDTSITFEEALAYKLTPRLLSADRVKDDVVRLARGKTVGGRRLDAAADLLAAWDGTTKPESRGGVLFIEFVDAYLARTKTPFTHPWDPAAPMTTPRGIGDADAAVAALAAACTKAEKLFGAIDVPWGDVYRLRIGGVDAPLTGQDGDYGAYRAMYFMRDKDNKMVARGGDSYVFAVEFSEPIRAVSILPYGQTFEAASRHDDDQAAMFAAGEFKPVWFSEADLAPHIERTYRP